MAFQAAELYRVRMRSDIVVVSLLEPAAPATQLTYWPVGQGDEIMLPYTPIAVAECMLERLDAAAAANGVATLAIPGGRSPGPVLTELARICSAFVRQRLHLFWVDERAVPVGHADRNDAATLSAWEQGGPLPAFVHPMPAEHDDLDAAAEQYAAEVTTVLQGRPLDVVFLGYGEDGHIASLFPHHHGLDELGVAFPVVDSPKPPSRRLSLTLPVINEATCKIALALGAEKGAVAARARTGPDRAFPISLLGELIWFADDAAISAVND
ncbi:MAG: 6-phosphogluconolactonase [Sphaerospermopsis sp. SIO1G2]|nr:6-phosphogluconolactonase [Sphaerospermopsis sp. SIO1G2]